MNVNINVLIIDLSILRYNLCIVYKYKCKFIKNLQTYTYDFILYEINNIKC